MTTVRRAPVWGASALVAVVGVLLFAGRAAAAPAPVPCSAAGSGWNGAHYNCDFYVAGDGHSGGAPVKASGGSVVGFLHKGTNWVVCQRQGARETSGGYYNSWWAYTLADNNQAGWINAVYASGGDNDGKFGGGAPDCGNRFPQPPGGHPDGGSPSPPPPPPPPPPGAGCSSAPGAGNNVTRWNPVIFCVLGMLGQPRDGNIINAVDILIQRESSGNPRAINLWDSNAKAGHPSKGLIQTIDSTFRAYRSPILANDVYDPAANIYAGLNYGINRYGSITDIPGIHNVLNGKGYVGYAATQTHGLKKAGRCGSVRAGKLTLSLNAQGTKCGAAKRAAKALDRNHAIRGVSGIAENVQVMAAHRLYTCDVEAGNSHGAVRAVSCTSGRQTLWWAAKKRRHH